MLIKKMQLDLLSRWHILATTWTTLILLGGELLVRRVVDERAEERSDFLILVHM